MKVNNPNQDIFNQILTLLKQRPNRPEECLPEIKVLLQKFPEVSFHIDVTDKENPKNLLHEAVKLLDYNVTDAILRHHQIQGHGPSTVVNLEVNGHTPICSLAIKYNKLLSNNTLDILCKNIVNLLVDYGANLEAALVQITQQKCTNFVAIILTYPLDINVEFNGDTSLCIATKNKETEIAVLLLKHGAKVDIPDRENNMPLCIAFINSQVELIKLLLDHGANPILNNGFNTIIPQYSLLHETILNNDEDLIKLFAEKVNPSLLYSVLEWAKNENIAPEPKGLLTKNLLFSTYGIIKGSAPFSNLPSDIFNSIFNNLCILSVNSTSTDLAGYNTDYSESSSD